MGIGFVFAPSRKPVGEEKIKTIKAEKMTAYGFSNEEYFFNLIRFMTIPGIRC